jgi:NADH-quinone oxidoreductase subunit N
MEALQTLTVQDLWTLAPELALLVASVVFLVVEMFLPARVNRDLFGWLVLLSLAVSAALVCVHMADLQASGADGRAVSLLGGTYRVDDFANILKLVMLAAAGLVVLLSLGSVRREDIPLRGDYYSLIPPAVLGAMIMASSAELITLYVGLELMSITTYVLVAMRKNRPASGEAAFKYLVSGGVASAFILYGMSLLYGAAGSTGLGAIGEALGNTGSFSRLVDIGFYLMLAGFALKLALAPFHLWAADVYQGAPTPVTALLAVVTKGAVFAMAYRTLFNTMGQQERDLVLTALAVLAAAAMIVGTTGALRQSDTKRFLALSGVANAGILAIPLVLDLTYVHTSLFSEFVYYLIAYVFMNVGAFAVVAMVERAEGQTGLDAFAGLYHRAPWTAGAMTVLLCSLAGLPITGGFFGKLLILFGTVQTKEYWLAAILLGTTVVSYYVYFRIIRQMYMRGGRTDERIGVTAPAGIVIWICALASVALGVLPRPILGWIDAVFSLPADLVVW